MRIEVRADWCDAWWREITIGSDFAAECIRQVTAGLAEAVVKRANITDAQRSRRLIEELSNPLGADPWIELASCRVGVYKGIDVAVRCADTDCRIHRGAGIEQAQEPAFRVGN